MKSNCCNADVKVVGDETKHYECVGCSQACNIAVERKSNKTRSTEEIVNPFNEKLMKQASKYANKKQRELVSKADLINSFIRDVTKVHPMSKSEARRRLDEILDQQRARFNECMKVEVVEEEEEVIRDGNWGHTYNQGFIDGEVKKRQEIINIFKKYGFYEDK